MQNVEVIYYRHPGKDFKRQRGGWVSLTNKLFLETTIRTDGKDSNKKKLVGHVGSCERSLEVIQIVIGHVNMATAHTSEKKGFKK